jgi:regulator of replication initiation timing
MKYIYIIPVLLFIFSSCSQKTDEQIMELSLKVDSLSVKVDKLAEKNNALEIEILMLENKITDSDNTKQVKTDSPVPAAKPVASSASSANVKEPEKIVVDRQCQAIISSGKRCSRTALEGSKYCNQHKLIYEPDIPQKK